MKSIAVIDAATLGLFLYKVPKEFGSEEIEEFIDSKGHHLSNCSWGEFDGEINDERGEETPYRPTIVSDDVLLAAKSYDKVLFEPTDEEVNEIVNQVNENDSRDENFGILIEDLFYIMNVKQIKK